MTDALAKRITELEASLALPGLPDAAREVIERQLRELRTPAAPQGWTGTVNLGADGRIDGIAVGINLGRIVYGRDPEEDERRRLVWYLDRLASKLYRLFLRGLEQRLDQGEGMALPRVYAELATTSELVVATGSVDQLHTYLNSDRLRGVPVAEIKNPLQFLRTNYQSDWALPSVALIGSRVAYAIRPEERWEDLTVTLSRVAYAIRPQERREDLTVTLSRRLLATEALIQHQRLVLLGDPGGGKSTFIRYLAWTLAQRGLDQGSQAPALLGWPNDSHSLPLLLPLRVLARLIAIHGDQPAVVAAALSAELAAAYNVRKAAPLVEQALHSGAALLLFDGLDEVPLEHAPGRHADRRTVLRVIREFLQLYPSVWAVQTCRTRTFEEGLRDLLGWHVETLAPFTLGQIRYFIPAWYGELVASGQLDSAHAERIGQKLLAAITDPARPRLREMAATPLLLTMMVLILYNQGELPRDRPQLYERILDLLLGEWDKMHGGQSLAEAVGKPEWESRDFLSLLDRLCYEAHRDTTLTDGRGRLSRGVLYTALIDFFRQAQVSHPGEAALCCLEYFEQRSGLLAADAHDTYVFAHLTLQEHGVARYMAVQSDDPTGLILQHRADDRWREPILLGAGLLRPADLNALLTDLIDCEEHERAKPADRRLEDLILAAEIGADRDWNLLRTRPALKVERLRRDLKRGLVALLQDKTQPLPVNERVRAGFLLGELGDPRFPITLDEWRHELAKVRAGDATGYFCRVEVGTYMIGSVDDPDARDDEKPQHSVTFDASFWIARYPITNAQWRMWVEQAGGQQSYLADEADLNRPNQPAVGVTWHMCNDFCGWFSEKLGVVVRLPTEQEWEAAARGGDARHYPWGNDWRADGAATREDQETRGWQWSVPVGCCPVDEAPCGALDMAGNVWEWTTSIWQSYPGARKPFADDSRRVLRGGNWNSNRNGVRCAARFWSVPTDYFIIVGFRVVVAPRLAH